MVVVVVVEKAQVSKASHSHGQFSWTTTTEHWITVNWIQISCLPHLLQKKTSGMVFLWAACPSRHQPTVSKHWRKHKALTTTSDLASKFFHPPPDYQWKRNWSLHDSSRMPLPTLIRTTSCKSNYAQLAWTQLPTFIQVPNYTDWRHRCEQLTKVATARNQTGIATLPYMA